MRYNPRRTPSPEGSSTRAKSISRPRSRKSSRPREETEDGKSPFFIIAGAGISAPTIPLASEITQECKQIAAKYNRAGEPPGNSAMTAYSYWFEKAFPQAIQRQRYFKKLIAGKPISHANLRLAHLLSEKRLATLVVTPNFDDFLSRALALFGIPHIVWDYPNNAEQIDLDSPDLQIVHVHGTFRFYDLCNSEQDIKDRAADSRERVMTMTSLLDDTLIRYSPVVIGYSGWEGDTIMTALVRRLKGRLPNNLHWFCYRRSDADRLPDWLRNHRDVRLVLPPAPVKPDSQIAHEAGLADIATELEPTLTAQSVLDKLVGAFTESAPALTLDPIAFFADQLTKSLPPASSDKPGEDIYDLRDVIRRVELVRAAGEKKPTPVEAEIERVRDAVRRSAYLEALQAASQLEPKLTSEAQREMLIESVMSAAAALNDSSEAEIGAYELVLRLANKAGTSMRVQERTAKALLNKALVLVQLNRLDEAIELCEEVLSRFGDASEPALREQVARANGIKGGAMGRLNRGEEAIRAYGEVLRRFGDASEPALREQVALALYGQTFFLEHLGRNGEAIQAAEELTNRLGDTPDPLMRTLIVNASLEKGLALVRLKRHEDAVQTYDEVLSRFGDATEPALREQVARALVNKGIVLGQLNHQAEAIQTYDEVLRRFADGTEPVVREQIAAALVNKGATLGQLNRRQEEIQAYDEVLRRFADATEPVVRERVAMAFLYKGLTLNTLKRPQEARLSFQEVLKRFADSPDGGIQERVEQARTQLKSLDEPTAELPSQPSS